MSIENPLPLPEATPASPTPAASRKFRLSPRFTFEAMLIVLSVLLGFVVSEWRQVQADQELAERVQRNLRLEIEHNLAELEIVLERHQQVLQLIETADVSNSQLSGWDVIFSKIADAGGGLLRPALRKGAWDAAVSTGALRLLDYERVAEMSDIYTAQDDVLNLFDMLVGAYRTETFQPGLQRETVQVYRWTIVEMVNYEKLLLTRYKQFLEEGDEVAKN